MHQTTVRFGEDLWDALEQECERIGVSIAQYVREAALARIVYAAGRRGDEEFQLALELASGSETRSAQPLPAQDLEQLAATAKSATTVHERALREGSEAAALAAQAEVARIRARELRARADAYRARSRG